MTAPRVILRGSQDAALRAQLRTDATGDLRVVGLLFRLIDATVVNLPQSARFIVQDAIALPSLRPAASAEAYVQEHKNELAELFHRCSKENLVFGVAIASSREPNAWTALSTALESALFLLQHSIDGIRRPKVLLELVERGWNARVRQDSSPEGDVYARHVAVLDDRLQLFCRSELTHADPEIQARQIAAFGKPFADKLSSLRVAVVGCGGTGSPTATMLARSGVGELVLIDPDSLDASNLNRVRGLRARDIGKPKAPQLKNFIESIGLPIRVAAYEAYVDQAADAVDALASCDVVFGCTDDYIGREVLSVSLCMYAQVLIDVGLGGKIAEDHGVPSLRYHHARISTVLPEWGACLFCQGAISEAEIRTQYADRENPNMTPEERRVRYLTDGATSAPGVGPFTNAASDYAIATLFDLVKPFRRFPPELRRDMFSIDFVAMNLSSVEQIPNSDCPYCGTRSLCSAVEEYRLGRPSLGKCA